MDIIIRADAQEVGKEAAAVMAPFIKQGRTIGLATGSSPLTTYRELIRMYESGELTFKTIQAFLLDEYVGLARDDKNSYFRTIRDEFTAHVDFVDANVHSPDSTDPDPYHAAALYEQKIIDTGVAIQLLGVGVNGHIGFNEPTSALQGPTKVQALHPQTIKDNARFFNDCLEDVPTHAMTQGLGTITRAENIIMVATGEAKADAIHRIVEGPLTALCPGSVLQLHANVTLVVDEAAASRLEHADYYRTMEQIRLR